VNEDLCQKLAIDAQQEGELVVAAAGRRQQALWQYETLRDTLRRELEADPDPETRALYREHFADARRERLFLSSVAFFLTFAIVRAITYAIRSGVGSCARAKIPLASRRQRRGKLVLVHRRNIMLISTDVSLTQENYCGHFCGCECLYCACFRVSSTLGKIGRPVEGAARI